MPAPAIPSAKAVPEPPQPAAPVDALAAAPRQLRRPPPRKLFAGVALALVAWQLVAGRPGVALLAAAALLPLLLLPSAALASSPLALLAPALGAVSLAAAYPAIAGQLRRWEARCSLGALGYWWLALAEPLLARRLWLGPPHGLPARAAWEGSLHDAAVHAVGPLLSSGVLLGAALWAAAAVVLPWIVRGGSAAVDVVAATMWSAGLAAATPALAAGLPAHAVSGSPRGAVAGAVLGGVIAVAARALRGPVGAHRA
jgi:hypothetical protein